MCVVLGSQVCKLGWYASITSMQKLNRRGDWSTNMFESNIPDGTKLLGFDIAFRPRT